MSVGIIGLGFVGNAMYQSFKLFNIDIIGFDKYKNGGIGKFQDILNTNILFLALPTPFDTNINMYNYDSIEETLKILKDSCYEGVIVIKSTLTPETTDFLESKYNLPLIHNPEFLTARTAFEDFHNQKHIVLGKGELVSEEKYKIILDFYKKYYPNAEISECSSKESESMKLFLNSFYAVKVQFFTELYSLCQKNNTNFENIKNIMLKNNWINPMHTNIPGPDGNISYGGMCFPKDTNALNQYMIEKKSFNKIIESCINERNSIRDD